MTIAIGASVAIPALIAPFRRPRRTPRGDLDGLLSVATAHALLRRAWNERTVVPRGASSARIGARCHECRDSELHRCAERRPYRAADFGEVPHLLARRRGRYGRGLPRRAHAHAEALRAE